VIKFKLAELLHKHDITRNALAREAKVRPNLIYEICDNQTKRIEVKTLNQLVITLRILTNQEINIEDIFEYVKEEDH
jgi:DNA-binding Xre family transcriptional regulator